jgi:transcriptional regulator with XRE-family HTH domain
MQAADLRQDHPKFLVDDGTHPVGRGLVDVPVLGSLAGGADGQDGVEMGELWKIIQAHLDKYGVREAEFARRMGSSPQTLNSWKNRGLKNLPSKALLAAVAEQAHVPYGLVLNAALHDIGYIGGHPAMSGQFPIPQPAVPAGDAKEEWELARRTDLESEGVRMARESRELGEESQVPPDDDETD